MWFHFNLAANFASPLFGGSFSQGCSKWNSAVKVIVFKPQALQLVYLEGQVYNSCVAGRQSVPSSLDGLWMSWKAFVGVRLNWHIHIHFYGQLPFVCLSVLWTSTPTPYSATYPLTPVGPIRWFALLLLCLFVCPTRIWFDENEK